MGYVDLRFPTGLSYSTSGGPRNPAYLSDDDGGLAHVVNRYTGALHEFKIEYSDKTSAEIAELISFFLICEGSLFSFRFKDWSDFTTAEDHVGSITDMDEDIGVGDGTERTFQLSKTYLSGAESLVRTITKPVLGTVVVSVDGVPTADFDVNYELGTVSLFNIPVLNAVIRAGFEFDVPVRFADGSISISKETYEGSAVSTVRLIEVSIEDLWTGGHNGGADYYSVVVGSPGKVLYGNSPKYLHVMNTLASHATVFLPPKAYVQGGGPQFIISNDVGSLDHVDVKDIDSVALIVSIAANRTALFWLTRPGYWSYMLAGY
jgi:uncharacterized protein (TIGR02217 family)